MNKTHHRITIEELKQYIIKYNNRRAPGLLALINAMVRRNAVDFFFSNSSDLCTILMKHYDTKTAYFIVEYAFVKPILIKLNRLDLEDDLMKLALRDKEAFKEMLVKLINSHIMSYSQ